MVTRSIITALVGRIPVLVDRRPFPDSVTLVSPNTPVLPEVPLLQPCIVDRVVGQINGEVVMKTGCDIIGEVTECVIAEEERVVSTARHELSFV